MRKKKYAIFSRRLFVIGAIKAVFLGLIGYRYCNLQLFSYKQFSTLSDRNRLKLILVPPPRALIYDCNNAPLVENKIDFSLGIEASYITEAVTIIAKIEEILGSSLLITEKELSKKIARRQPNDYLFLKHQLNWKEVAILLEHEDMLQGVEIVETFNRHYKYGQSLAHILGYVAYANKKEIVDDATLRSSQIKVGKIGVEKVMDKGLRGSPGFRKTEVDVKGKIVRILESESVQRGNDVTLSIDAGIQEKIHNLFTQHNLVASGIVLNAKTGAVIALHSTPSFDPNLFVSGISHHDWDVLLNMEHNPLINKAVSSAYPPGSTFKIVTALAALQSGINPNDKHTCTGEFKIGNSVFRCWNHAGHGAIDMRTAIPQSCNPYLFDVSLKIGIKKIHDMAKLLGLGAATGIELDGEVNGLVPDPVWKQNKYRVNWYTGDTLNTSIGQGFTLVTPMQIATMTARIASGSMVLPYLISPKEIQKLDISENALAIVKKGMYDCVNSPNGVLYKHNLSSGRMTICGKTGTAQVVALKHKNKRHDFMHHGLFTSFAPFHDPQYVVTVVVEHAGAGSKVAPYAAEIYKYLQ